MIRRDWFKAAIGGVLAAVGLRPKKAASMGFPMLKREPTPDGFGKRQWLWTEPTNPQADCAALCGPYSSIGSAWRCAKAMLGHVYRMEGRQNLQVLSVSVEQNGDGLLNTCINYAKVDETMHGWGGGIVEGYRGHFGRGQPIKWTGVPIEPEIADTDYP